MYFCLEIYILRFLFNSGSPVFSRFRCYYYNYYFYYCTRCVLEIGPEREVFRVILLLRNLPAPRRRLTLSRSLFLFRSLYFLFFSVLYYYRERERKKKTK